ncbi:MAG: S-layer homology domain-containing protein [Firmicutes bacterium]|jgi:hypothetical protein|nr:S-layer homology domain-containing protein [Bacillota bacterium]
MLFSSFSFGEEKSLDDKAYALNVLTILKGMDGDYNYMGELTRAQAATFIVRLMGKEDYVLSNKKKFIKTPFPDVKEDDWFAPYVGYCFTNDIIDGDTDGTYKPNDNVSEKAFTKMVLGVLDYEYGKDYKWETVFPFAFEKKLVTDISYAVKDSDNYNFYRKDAINLLYDSLLTLVNGEEMNLVEKLVDDKVISNSKVKALGMIKSDKEQTEIEGIEVISDQKIVISINEEIEDPDIDDIEIENDGNELEVKSMKVDNKKITLVTSVMKEKTKYIVLFDKITDDEGFETEDIQGDFTSFERPAIEDPMFKISKVIPVNQKEIHVYFTHPLTKDSNLELLYNIYANDKLFVEGSYKYMDIIRLGSSDKAVSIILKENKFIEGETYKLSVKGDMKSEYDVYLNRGYGDEYEFRGNNVPYEDLEIVDVDYASEKFIVIEFNKEIDIDSAMDKDNYTLQDDESGVIYSNPKDINVEESGDFKNRRVFVYFTKMKDDRSYTIWIDNIEDLHQQSIVTYEKFDLVDDIPDEELDVDNDELIDNKSFYLYFNRNLSKKSEKANIKSDGAMRFSEIQFDEEYPDRLKIYLDGPYSFTGNKDYELTITGLYDYLGQEQEEKIEYDLDADKMDPMEINVEDAVFISDKKILMVFDNDISLTKDDNEGFYSIEYKDDDNDKVKVKPDNVVVVDSRNVILELDDKIEDSVVVIRIDYLYDYSGENKVIIGSTIINND